MRDPSSPTRERTCFLSLEMQNLHHWAAREALSCLLLMITITLLSLSQIFLLISNKCKNLPQFYWHFKASVSSRGKKKCHNNFHLAIYLKKYWHSINAKFLSKHFFHYIVKLIKAFMSFISSYFKSKVSVSKDCSQSTSMLFTLICSLIHSFIKQMFNI